MNINVTAVPPAPGSAEPANLYVDLQSRALWLGVDQTIDANGAVLIADIVQTQADIAASVVTAKTYTDAQIVTRAPVVHTHTASQIVDFNAAVDAAVSDNPSGAFGVVPIAGIILWGGYVSDIGVGVLANWHLCDGSQVTIAGWGPWTTPDLRDRFIIGAGNKGAWSTNALTSFKTDIKGHHTHTINGTALTEANLAGHAHYVTIAGRAHGATYDNGGGDGPHPHLFDMRTRQDAGSTVHGSFAEGGSSADIDNIYVSGGWHSHYCYVDIGLGATTDYRGSGTAHTHSAVATGLHDHTITSAQLRDNIPYYALAYIVRIA